MFRRGEADKIMAATAADALAITDEVKAGTTAAARRFVLLAAWRRILGDSGIPRKTKPLVFRALADNLSVEVVPNG